MTLRMKSVILLTPLKSFVIVPTQGPGTLSKMLMKTYNDGTLNSRSSRPRNRRIWALAYNLSATKMVAAPLKGRLKAVICHAMLGGLSKFAVIPGGGGNAGRWE
jgi:hypothetical protein